MSNSGFSLIVLPVLINNYFFAYFLKTGCSRVKTAHVLGQDDQKILIRKPQIDVIYFQPNERLCILIIVVVFRSGCFIVPRSDDWCELRPFLCCFWVLRWVVFKWTVTDLAEDKN